MLTDIGLAVVQVVALVAALCFALYSLSNLESALDQQEPQPARVLTVRLALVVIFLGLVVAVYRRMGF